MIGSCLLVPADHGDLAQVGLTVAGAVLVPLALTAYPRLHWRHPVDFVALVAVVGAGLLAVARWSDIGAVATMGLVIVMVLIASIWWRIERSQGDERWALVWMALGAGVTGLAAGLLSFASASAAGGAVAIALFTLLGPAMYVGVARPEVRRRARTRRAERRVRGRRGALPGGVRHDRVADRGAGRVGAARRRDGGDRAGGGGDVPSRARDAARRRRRAALRPPARPAGCGRERRRSDRRRPRAGAARDP